MGTTIIRPLRKRLIVRLEGTDGGKLSEYTSEGGIVIAGAELSNGSNMQDGLKARWAEVLATGPECSLITIGDRILIESGKWTEASKVGSEFFWMTEEKYVMIVDDVYLASEGKNKTIATIE